MNYEGSLLFAQHLFLTIYFVTASCPETAYLERGVDGTIDCSYEDYQLIHWSITGDTDALIAYQNNVKDGPGCDSGEYDLLLNGSLIIRNVSLQHERQYSLGGFTNQNRDLSSLVTVRVFVRPIPEYPVMNGLTDRQNQLLKVERLWDMDCAMENIRPAVSLEWVIADGFSLNNLGINNDTTTSDHGDGTFSIHLRSHFKIEDPFVRSLTISCVVIGPDVLSSKTSADVLFPAISNDPSLDPVSTELVPDIDGGYSEHPDFMRRHHRQTTALLVIVIVYIGASLVYLVIYRRKLLIRAIKNRKEAVDSRNENQESNDVVEMSSAQQASVEIHTLSDRPHSSTLANRAEAIESDSNDN